MDLGPPAAFARLERLRAFVRGELEPPVRAWIAESREEIDSASGEHPILI